ncbi:MAG: radical SAM protein [Mariprofundus sp.]
MTMRNTALVFDIKRDASEDGPGIRTTVFLKGCPLSCVWCHNPEGRAITPEQDSSGRLIGTPMTVDELLYCLLQDKLFFLSSGGGVTLSGGEPTMQMDFSARLLQRLKGEGIHTAIETCGFFHYQSFKEKLLPWLDLIYFDLKLIDDDASRLYCGRSNRRILRNFARLLADSDIPVIPRIPLIPGITSTEKNLRGIAALLKQHGITECALMPYNPLWQDKLPKESSPAYKHTGYMSAGEQAACVHCFTRSIDQGRASCK